MNERKAEKMRDRDWQTAGVRKRGGDGDRGWEREAPAVLIPAAFLSNSKVDCCFLHCTKGNSPSMCADNENSTEPAHPSYKCITDSRGVKSKVWSWKKLSKAYLSKDVISQWRQGKLVKHAQGNEDHLRVAEHWVKAKTWWLRKRWHV